MSLRPLLDFGLAIQTSAQVSARQFARRSRRAPRTRDAILIFSLFLVCSAFLASCATSKPMIENVTMPYPTLKGLVTRHMPRGVREESPNGRTMTSHYFNPTNFDQDGAELQERAYGVVTILGSSRPYKLDVQVFHETKSGSVYEKAEKDSDLSQKLGERLKRALADRREDRNAIDEFRAF